MMEKTVLSLFAAVMLVEVLAVIWLVYKLRRVLAVVFVGYISYTVPQSILFLLVLSVVTHAVMRMELRYRRKMRCRRPMGSLARTIS